MSTSASSSTLTIKLPRCCSSSSSSEPRSPGVGPSPPPPTDRTDSLATEVNWRRSPSTWLVLAAVVLVAGVPPSAVSVRDLARPVAGVPAEPAVCAHKRGRHGQGGA